MEYVLLVGIQPVVGIGVRLVKSIVFVFLAVVVAGSNDSGAASALLMDASGRRHAFVGRRGR
jgi:hypothetical protein